MLDENGDIVTINIHRGQSIINEEFVGRISFKYINIREIPNGEVTKSFYLRLPDSFNNPNSDIDTLKFVYELLYQGGCTPIGFKSFKVSYNDSIYTDEKLTQFALFIKK